MASWNEDMRRMKERLDLAQSVPEAAGAIVEMMTAHPEAIATLEGSFRFAPSDGDGAAYCLTGGQVTPLAESEPADVTVSGQTTAMLDVLRGTQNPVKLLLTGKVKVKGDKGLLLKVAKLVM